MLSLKKLENMLKFLLTVTKVTFESLENSNIAKNICFI